MDEIEELKEMIKHFELVKKRDELKKEVAELRKMYELKKKKRPFFFIVLNHGDYE